MAKKDNKFSTSLNFIFVAGSGIQAPVSGMGKKSGSGINIPDPQCWDVCTVPEVSHAALGASDQVEADRHLEAPRPVVLLVQGQRTLQEPS